MPKRVYPTKEPVIKWIGKGVVKANCTQAGCGRLQNLDQFTPAISNQMHRKRQAFLDLYNAIMAIDRVLNNPDALALVNEMGLRRLKHCLTCRLKLKKSRLNPTTVEGACRAKWHELKAAAEEKGCALCGCNDAISYEHVDPSTKMTRTKNSGKVEPVHLSAYPLWSALGGPAAMQREADEKCIVLCENCHGMQPTGTAMTERIDPNTLPDVSKRCDKAAYNKKYGLLVKREKQVYVEGIKLQIGGCAECTMQVVPRDAVWRPGQSGWPHVFCFAHRSELDKEHGVGKLVTRTIKLATLKPMIDKEIARCRLLCKNCNKVETDARADAPGPSEERV